MIRSFLSETHAFFNLSPDYSQRPVGLSAGASLELSGTFRLDSILTILVPDCVAKREGIHVFLRIPGMLLCELTCSITLNTDGGGRRGLGAEHERREARGIGKSERDEGGGGGSEMHESR